MSTVWRTQNVSKDVKTVAMVFIRHKGLAILDRNAPKCPRLLFPPDSPLRSQDHVIGVEYHQKRTRSYWSFMERSKANRR